MSYSPLTAIKPEHVDAANALHSSDSETAAVLTAQIRRLASRSTDVDGDDVAALASILAPVLLTDGHGTSEAATVAVRRAAGLLRADRPDTASIEGNTTEDGTVLLRMVTPHAPDPAVAYGTTNRDRYADALAALDGDDATTADALLSHEWKGNKVPAAAVRRALGLPPVTGRAGTAWTATVTEDAARVLPALEDAYRSTLTLHAQGCEGWEPASTYGLPRMPRRCDADAVKADRASKARPADDARRVEDSRATSGPASDVLTYRLIMGTPVNVATGRTLSLQERHGVRASRPVEAFTVASRATRKAEQDVASWLPAEGTTEHAGTRRLPGVTVDDDGQAVAPSGQAGSNAGAGTSKAAMRHAAPRKRSRGSTGPTVPARLTRR